MFTETKLENFHICNKSAEEINVQKIKKALYEAYCQANW